MKNEHLEQLEDHLQKQLRVEHDTAIMNGQVMKNYSQHLREIIGKQREKNTEMFEEWSVGVKLLMAKADIFSDSLSIISKVLYRQAVNINFLKVMQQCKAHLIPSVLVETGALRKDLEKIQANLKKHDRELAININDIHTYLMVKSTDCYFSNNEIKIRIKIPHITRGNSYKYFSVEKQPYIYDDKVCVVDIEEDTIVEKNGNTIIPLSKASTRDCMSSLLCYVPRFPLHLSHSQYCLDVSLMGRTKIPELRKSCPQRCSDHNLKKPIILHIDYKEYGIIYPNSTIKVQCAGKKDEVISTENQVGLLTIKLSCACKILVGNEIITNEFPCPKDDEGSQAGITHEISASWAYAADELFINKHTSFHNVTKVVDDAWIKQVPVYDPFIVTELPFKPTFHQMHAHYFSYTSLFIVIIVIVVLIMIIFKGKKVLSMVKMIADPTTIVQKIVALLSSRVTVTEARSVILEDSLTMYITYETIKIMLLLSIFFVLAWMLYFFLTSKFLNGVGVRAGHIGNVQLDGCMKVCVVNPDNIPTQLMPAQARRENTKQEARESIPLNVISTQAKLERTQSEGKARVRKETLI